MFKRIITMILAVVMVVGIVGCKSDDVSQNSEPENTLEVDANGLYIYEDHEFVTSGFWAPYDITEESFKQYKDIGFTTLNMINHSLSRTSENQFYLGSERTMKALEICEKVGLKAILNYNDWVADQCGDSYNSDTPFSKYDLYGEYKDIITGIHIVDEPSKHHYDIYADKTFMDDFKKVYPNANYIVNLSPKHAGGTYWDFTTYDELVNTYEEKIMTYFDNKFISVDFYPFVKEEHNSYPRHDDWMITYEMIANLGKKYDAYKTAIIQSSVTNEFAKELTEADMRFQVNMALAFGFDHIQYYCYSVPATYNADGTIESYMYEHCILNQDNTPNEMYYWLQDIHKEIQSFSSVILSYDWDSVIAVNPVGFSSNMDMSTMMRNEFTDTQYYDSAISSTDLVITRFTSDKYGEAYMLVNYAQKDKNNVATVTFKNCKKVAVYGGNGFDGTPEIVELDEENKYRVDLAYGEGVFVVPIV